MCTVYMYIHVYICMHIHIHDNSYLSELLLFHLSRVVGHLEVTFEHLFIPVFDGLAIRILVLCLRLV